MELAVQTTNIHDVTRTDLLQVTNGNHQVQEWSCAAWTQPKPQPVKHGTTAHLDGPAKSRCKGDQCVVDLQASEDSLRFEELEMLSWIDIIPGNFSRVKNEGGDKLYHEMHKSNGRTDTQVLVSTLQACSSMGSPEEAEWIHSHIIKMGLESDPHISCALVDMYAKSGSLDEACGFFNTACLSTVEMWNALIAGYLYHQEGEKGLKVFGQMQLMGIKPSRVTFICVLKACSSIVDLEQGRRVHALSVENGLEHAMFVGNTLIDMYVNCDSLDDAHTVFARLPTPDTSACNALLGGHAQSENLQETLSLIQIMQNLGIQLDRLTFVSILKACSNMRSIHQGRLIHAKAVENGVELDELVANCLMHMYLRCASFKAAEILLDQMPEYSVVSWSTLLTGYAESGEGQAAWQVFSQMRHCGIEPNQVTFVSLLKGCSRIAALEEGREAHKAVIEGGFENDVCIGNALIDMYVKCGSLEEANIVFHSLPSRNIVTWTALIGGYSQHGHPQEALSLFDTMQKEGLEPNPVTFASILRTCASEESLCQGRHVHAQIVEYGQESDPYVGNSLVNMYSDCHSLDDALQLLNRSCERGVCMWNAIITGYVRQGQCQLAVQCYEDMQYDGSVSPDSVTYVCVLPACSSREALEQGISIHADIVYGNFLFDVCVGSALVDMYVNCGSLEDAHRVFCSLPERNVVTWNVLLRGFTEAGEGNKTLQLFCHMEEDGLKPDTVTFLSTTKACSTMAALQHGHSVHTEVIKWGLEMDVSIGNSLVDMYANCSSLSEAEAIFDRLPTKDIVSWSALIAGYAQHNDYLGALRCYESLIEWGHKPDMVTLISLLSACSRGGLVDKGIAHFKSIRESLGIEPTLELYNPLVDLLGRVGALHEAEDLLESLPFQKNMVGWATLLASSRQHSNQDVARRCFNCVVEINSTNAAPYVIMSNIYSRSGQLREAREIEELRKLANAWKKPAKAFIEIESKVHEFIVGDMTHPQSDDIHTKLRALNAKLKREGHQPHLDLVLNCEEDDDKEMALCGHSEKLAIAFGLLSTSPSTSLRIAKNLRMCSDCHVATKLISRIEKRNIIVKDAYCIHQFQEGLCSCEETNFCSGTQK